MMLFATTDHVSPRVIERVLPATYPGFLPQALHRKLFLPTPPFSDPFRLLPEPLQSLLAFDLPTHLLFLFSRKVLETEIPNRSATSLRLTPLSLSFRT
jgi:hypothetical protein